MKRIVTYIDGTTGVIDDDKTVERVETIAEMKERHDRELAEAMRELCRRLSENTEKCVNNIEKHMKY